ncbi:MAG TPA: hypothetical protein V6D19_04850 [Stenomitos sp.]
MSEQYAFAIGFDFDLPHHDSEKGSEPVGQEVYGQVATALVEAGLPPLDSDRWDEFGQGRIFWGTKAECDVAHQVLSRFNLYIQEERNLEPGYYAKESETYYVDAAGQIYVVPPESQINGDLSTVASIPLDAYRLKTIDAARAVAMQQALHASTPSESALETPNGASTEAQNETPQVDLEAYTALQAQLETLRAEHNALHQSLAAKIEPDIYAGLQQQYNQQLQQTETLQQQITALENELAGLQTSLAGKIDPEAHQAVQAQLAQQTEQVEALKAELQQLASTPPEPQGPDPQVQVLEQRLAQAEAQTVHWQQKAEQAADPETMSQLQTKYDAQSVQVIELQQFIQRLEQQLQETTSKAAQKVDPEKYQTLVAELSDQKALTEDLRKTVHQLERDLGEWQTVAEAKVDWAEHQALQRELQQLRSRPKGFWARLFGR